MSSHYSNSALLLKRVICVLQLDSPPLVGLIHTPFLSPSPAWGRKDTDGGICLTVGSCFMCSIWRKKRWWWGLFFVLYGGTWQREPTWGAVGLRTGWFVWRSHLLCAGLAARRFPWNQSVEERSSRSCHTLTRLHMYEVQTKTQTHMSEKKSFSELRGWRACLL